MVIIYIYGSSLYMVIIIRLTFDSTLLKLTCQHHATVCKEAYPRHLDNSSTNLFSHISFHHHHCSVNDHPQFNVWQGYNEIRQSLERERTRMAAALTPPKPHGSDDHNFSQ